MYYARAAALRLDQQRVWLRTLHKSLLADLNKCGSGRTAPAELSGRIDSLRRTLRKSMIESIEVSTTLIERTEMLNLGSMAEAVRAQTRLHQVHRDVTKTLSELDKGAAERS
ncbi:hypothetical protein [Bradyrhizobium arachidis]|uniref:hypothetical protein n=1 Tax=Bradyrhizobium arachidis TaxID=858423 RepID=UPI0021625720|nr:hypothetical protein [Bradyrhizobium arachidis]UVO27598.1 hypothetical protein KUF59_34745 [Bradyrhizobium arachidis]